MLGVCPWAAARDCCDGECQAETAPAVLSRGISVPGRGRGGRRRGPGPGGAAGSGRSGGGLPLRPRLGHPHRSELQHMPTFLDADFTKW